MSVLESDRGWGVKLGCGRGSGGGEAGGGGRGCWAFAEASKLEIWEVRKMKFEHTQKTQIFCLKKLSDLDFFPKNREGHLRAKRPNWGQQIK